MIQLPKQVTLILLVNSLFCKLNIIQIPHKTERTDGWSFGEDNRQLHCRQRPNRSDMGGIMKDTKIEVIRKMAAAIDELEREAERDNLPMLVYLLGMARLEAQMVMEDRRAH